MYTLIGQLAEFRLESLKLLSEMPREHAESGLSLAPQQPPRARTFGPGVRSALGRVEGGRWREVLPSPGSVATFNLSFGFEPQVAGDRQAEHGGATAP